MSETPTYKKIKILKRGNDSNNYLVLDNKTKVYYELKNINISKNTEKERKKYFHEEKILLKSLDHPNIIKLKEIFA